MLKSIVGVSELDQKIWFKKYMLLKRYENFLFLQLI